MKTSLTDLEHHQEFLNRHIGISDSEEAALLSFLGYPTRDSLIDAVIPKQIRQTDALPLSNYLNPRAEVEALAVLEKISSQNKLNKSFKIGRAHV